MLRSAFAVVFIGLLMLAAPAMARPRAAQPFPNLGYAQWSNDDPAYRFYPGDEIAVSFPTAPELDQSVQVAPDGRISLPLIAPVMAAERTVVDVERALDEAYASQLLDPEVSVSVKQAAALQVFVGGQVGKPGVYEFSGDMDALRAIIEAGGFTTGARRNQVIIIRRGTGGAPMARMVDLKRALSGDPRADLVPLRRFDIVYVPRTTISDLGVFVQQYFRDLLPGSFGLTYGVGGQAPVSPSP
ncbi:MAG: polysaccharide biosynthesis/export family protein [Caulobacteraceae bacterium]